MSGVRNLRAMFEQKGDALPDRGRSPGPGGIATPSPSASPRPLSKVRTSFVAIEKDGRIGLRREPSRDSETVSSRRFSNDTDTSTPQPVSERSDVFSDNMASTVASFKTNLSHEAIPESPRQDTPVKFSPKKDLKSPPLKPNANPDKVTDEEEPQTKMLSGNPTEASAARLGGTILNGGISDALNGTPSTTAQAKVSGASKPASKKVAAPVSTAKTATKAPKSPLTSKAPSAKEPTKPAVSANTKKVTTTKTAASKPAPIELPSSGTGFVKPKPKSPTRPVKLPSSLTTHTAASAQKLGAGGAAPPPRRSLSRASGSAQLLAVNPTTHRSPSRNSVSTTGTTTAKTLKHRASSANVGRSRPSLGPPPKPVVKEQPAPKKEAHVDEGFLARMMRPTASSAKKTAEKVPVTPPRKQSTPAKKPDAKDVGGNAKKVAAKIQASSTQAKTTKSVTKSAAAKEQPTAKEIAPAVAQAETAEAAIEKAKESTDTAETPVVEEKAEVEAEPAVEDNSANAAQGETADDKPETVETPTEVPAPADVSSNEEPESEPEPTNTQPMDEPTTIVVADAIEPAASVPAVSEDPLKVEDIEDTVHEAQEPSHQLQSTDPTAEASEAEDIPEVESIPAPTAEPEVEVKETVDEPLESVAETVADTNETTGEEAKTEAKTEDSPNVDFPHDADAKERIDESVAKEETAAPL